MSEEEKQQDGQKTIVAFIVGLLIGGLLVWVFSGSPEEAPVAPSDSSSDTTAVEDSVSDDTSSEPENEDDDAGVISSGSNTTNETSRVPSMEVGEGSVEVSDQAAGMTVTLDGAVFPTNEGWIGVRSYANGQLSSLLGVARFSEEQGLVPEEVTLLAPTRSGEEYALVFYTESGDREFSLADDVQIDEIFATFTAQ